MTNEIVLLVVLLLLSTLMFLIVFSLNNIKHNKELHEKSINKSFITTGNSLLLLMIISIFNVVLFDVLDNVLETYAVFLIVIFGGNLLIALFGLLPILTLSEKYPLKVVKSLKIIIIGIAYLLLPLSAIYLILRKLVYKPTVIKMTEDEFLDIIDKAEQEDGINEAEKDLIKSVLDFDDLKVIDIFTPRIDIIAIEDTSTNDEIIKSFKDSGLSRLPVYSNSIDNIIGTINHKDFYNDVLLDNKSLKSIIIKPVEIPEYMPAKNLLLLLRTSKSHMAIVKDEYGGTLGLVTMEDILEELVGDIYDEHDKVTVKIKKTNNYKYIITGQTYLDELEDIIDLKELEDEDYTTVNGWALANLGKMGKPGDSFKYKNMEVIVKKANNKMILEVELNIEQ